MVEFYSEWCGHCRNFAPTFKEVAQLAKPWSRYISVGAVNCVDEKTVCLDHKVTRYPTIRYFTHPSPQNSSTTLELEHAGGRSAQHLHGEIAAVLFSRWHEVPVGERLHPGFAEVFEEDAR
ncbi:hypothetical protein SARC_04440 [Sphaeroforma arctica JP610]|uniref:Thioredoxin domain-containing protein n=1 Tax=Sphaeroforma arctica JP610 TaxID=667725 RepID=A0A0L0G2K8_9EUKA|nr:hypothetical protein SARC_04440 [Sphaeroforma arctica JP610]KNC83315.1 hypothetical protein SARC_04440 [Sphaeroforma arctica JP610]|eukprot:XP_014157217.1 hypothetical protein SARC_04440 [Sphaeroforma arctica JP610]